MHQQQKHLVCQRNSLFCTNSLPSFTMCQYLSNTLPFLLVFNCIINSQSTLCRFINCFALLRVLSYLSDFSYSPEFIGKGVVFDGKRYSVSQIQNMVSPPHPSSTSGTLQKPAPTFQVFPEPQKKIVPKLPITCLQAPTPTTTMFLRGAGRPRAKISAIWYPEITVCSHL